MLVKPIIDTQTNSFYSCELINNMEVIGLFICFMTFADKLNCEFAVQARLLVILTNDVIVLITSKHFILILLY